MKWCMVAAMAVSLLLGGVAQAQEDEFDLDALLGDFESPEQVEEEGVGETADDAGAVEAVEADWAVEEAVAEDAVEEAVAEEAFEDAVVEEAVEEADPFADDFAMEEAAEEALDEADPFAEEVLEEAAADVAAEDAVEEELAEDAVEEAWAEESVADETVEETVEDVATDDDLLADLFAEEPVEEEAPDEAFDAFAPMAEEPVDLDEDLGADFTDMDFDDAALEETAEDAPAGDETTAAADTEDVKELARQAAAQEEIRRQAAEVEALKASETGFQALSNGKYIEAENSFSSALATLPDRPQNDDVRVQIAWGLAEAKYLRARNLIQSRDETRLPEARDLVDGALETAPDHRGAQALERRLTKLEKLAAMPKAPAEQAATIEEEQTIEKMYDEARQWYMIKDYDRAKALFEQILLRDPYHKSAMRYLRKLEADKYKLATYEREARVQGMMTEVRRSWSPPIRAAVELPAGQEPGTGVDSKPGNVRLQDKMQKIIIPEVQFRQANINDVVNFLVEASIAADPEGEGVNIILNLGQSGGGGGAPAPAPALDPMGGGEDLWGDLGGEDFGEPMGDVGGGAVGIRDITLNLRRISMLDAIKYITEVAGLKYRIENTAVMITPLDAPVGNIVTRMYPVQPSFMDVIVERQGASAEDRDEEFVSMSGRVSMTKSDVKDFFEKTGVKFPSGASITYNATISQLIVANTADNLETFERILQQLNVVPNQVEIEARFIEVDQTDLEELGLQWILNDNYEFATKADGSGERLQVNANNNGLTQGNRFFSFNTGNLNIEPASTVSRAANQTMLGGILSASSVLTNPEVTVVLQALSQHGGSDLLSAPRVTTRSGVNAQIQVVKEIIYPTEFDVTQPTMNTDGNVTMSPVVTPGMFETRETGVILNVTPTVGPDGYTIDLVMAPEVAELVDWIQYGSEITVETGIIGARQQNTYLFNMPQPVFTSRNVTTSIVIWDGQTVVMGGLIREELTTIKDKVPILGDIPLLGWLFRSEGQYSRKKNLLIFVTARLVDPAGRPIRSADTMAMPGQGIETDAPDPAVL